MVNGSDHVKIFLVSHCLRLCHTGVANKRFETVTVGSFLLAQSRDAFQWVVTIGLGYLVRNENKYPVQRACGYAGLTEQKGICNCLKVTIGRLNFKVCVLWKLFVWRIMFGWGAWNISVCIKNMPWLLISNAFWWLKFKIKKEQEQWPGYQAIG